jgi:uroporphyrinogen-III synthase
MIQPHLLRGRRIVVTRNREAAGRLGDHLRALGAEVLEIPLIHVEADVDEVAAARVFREFGQFEWLIFTSRNGVRHFFSAFFREFDDIRSLGFLRLAAIGPGTAEALNELHLRVDLLPAEATAEGLAGALLAEQDLANLRILVVTGSRNRPVLVERLTQAGAIVDTLQVYRTVLTDLRDHPAARSFRAAGADAVVFASSSAVQSFGEQAAHLRLGPQATIPALVSLGPITSQTMRAAGIPVAAEAAHPDADSLTAALIACFGRQ